MGWRIEGGLVLSGLLALAVAGPPAHARAQAPEVGTLLRVPAAGCRPSTARRWAEGKLVAVRNDSLFIMSPPRSWTCPTALVGRLQVAANQDVEGFTLEESALEGTFIGGGIGLVLGVVGAYYFSQHYPGADCGTDACPTTGLTLTRKAAFAIGWAGTVFGMLAGATIDRMGWWDEVPVPTDWSTAASRVAPITGPTSGSAALVHAGQHRLVVGLSLPMPGGGQRADR